MSFTAPLPPSPRDFLAYQRIVLDVASTRTVAEELKISQTRVRQLVRRVLDWMQQTLPQDTDISEAAQLRVACHIAADRLEHFYGQANRLWEQTGHVKYANMAFRIIQAQTKIPAMPGAIEALCMDAILGPLPDNVVPSRREGHEAAEIVHPDSPSAPDNRVGPACAASAGPPTRTELPSPRFASQSALRNPQSEIPISPPIRDCSPSAILTASSAPSSTHQSSTTPSQSTPSDNSPTTAATARRQFLAPAHSSFGVGLPTPPKPPTAGLLREGEAPAEPLGNITELKITPETLGFTRQEKHSSRRDRRRLRQRMAAK